MTAIVGILCQDGVVLGTDSSATFAYGYDHTIEQPTEKIYIIQDRIILIGTGQVGLGQRFNYIIEKAWKSALFNKPAPDWRFNLCNNHELT